VTDACPNGAAAEDGFTDTGADGSAIESAVDCIVDYGVSNGTSDTTYSPSNPVNRGQMATFLMQKLDLVHGFTRPTNAPDAFTDDDGTTHETNIDDAAAIGLVNGLSGDVNGDGDEPDYGPTQSVTRGQMATFIVNQLNEANVNLPSNPPDAFTDDEGNAHEANINIVAALDIADGVTATTYAPNDPVTRGQMAFFLTRDLDLLVEQGLVTPLAGNNQDFTVDPAGLQLHTVSTPGGNEAATQYTATGLGTTPVNIALFPCDEVNSDTSTISFGDDEGNPGQADNIGTGQNPVATTTKIEVVNGVATGGTNTHIGDDEAAVTPTNGQVTFAVDSEELNCVTPVVFVDANNNSQLDLDSNDRPTEAFGVGGDANFIPKEHEGGAFAALVLNNPDVADFFIGDTDGNPLTTADQRVFNYDANDAFVVDGVPSTLEAFELAMSSFDTVTGSYAPDAGAVSTFALVDTTPPQATPPTATAGTPAQTSIKLTFAEVNAGLAEADSYNIFRAVDSTTGDDPACPAFSTSGVAPYTVVGTVARDADANPNTFTDTGLAPATKYCYAVQAVSEGDPGLPSNVNPVGNTNTLTTAAGAADTTKPLLVDSRVTTDTGLQNRFDTGDVLQLTFNEDMNASAAATGVFEVTDGNGDIFTLDCAGASTTSCVLSASGGNADRILTVTVGAVVDSNTAGNGLLEIPATITTTNAAVADAAGKPVNLAGSGDTVLDKE
jgi:hypothetical protein